MNDTNPVFAESVSTLTRAEFIQRFGDIYEHSPWVASRTWDQGVDESYNRVNGLAKALAATVDQSGRFNRLDLINAHPDLAGRAALAGTLTADSSDEQASAGIDQCTPEELQRFNRLNAAYRKKFGFTFVMAVKGSNRHKILAAFEQRLNNEPTAEFDFAIAEIHKIARLRLLEMVSRTTSSSLLCTPQSNPFSDCVDLAQPRLGSEVVYATDDFFADKSRLINPADPVFIPDKFDLHGKWMDGWESRRKRIPGHDYCVIRLGVPGVIQGVDINTAHFTGNFPPVASLEGCISDEHIPTGQTSWQELISKTDLKGDSHHYIAVTAAQKFTHLRLNIYPDGGVARLRVYGSIHPDWNRYRADEVIDLLALEQGGRALICNDEHFGSMRNLNAPGRGVNMGDGWETARRRTPGNDWVILALGHCGYIEKIEIDTAHFKGNYPDRVCIQAANTTETDLQELVVQSISWQTLLPEVKLGMDKQHEFIREIQDIGVVSHVRVSIFPDGGLSRIRLFGRIESKAVK